jgi:hypothetical protein
MAATVADWLARLLREVVDFSAGQNCGEGQWQKPAGMIRIAQQASKSMTPSKAPLVLIHLFTACRVASFASE